MNQQYMFKILNTWEDCAVNDISMPHQCPYGGVDLREDSLAWNIKPEDCTISRKWEPIDTRKEPCHTEGGMLLSILNSE